MRPSGARTPPTSSKPTVTIGVTRALTPPATTTLASPERSALTPSWIATSDDEHAVSMAIDGPRKSKKYDTRLAMMELAVPVMAYGCVIDGSETDRKL
ncbi:Uncharacterised protein [Mycobacteroides abscessus subsp. abscessus]|nr:Uncharacterised protein [Mycobacteroides abscessus subsp. abscessus]